MFPLTLVVRVVDGVVTFSVRTGDERVDEYTFEMLEFRELLAAAGHKPHNMVHVYVQATPTKREIYAVPEPVFSVMVAEFEAQLKE